MRAKTYSLVTFSLLSSAVAFVGACDRRSANKIVLRDDSGKRTLTYDCGTFRPQVETADHTPSFLMLPLKSMKEALSEKLDARVIAKAQLENSARPFGRVATARR